MFNCFNMSTKDLWSGVFVWFRLLCFQGASGNEMILKTRLRCIVRQDKYGQEAPDELFD